eukprot:CAMPEP_0180292372 /NCGR_PEP_ID=MMETSP0988-20121125/16733_1 /TAXON_ID=697907 /ORGANISM="non described non described, Strain CCMP2293" /LENGTH=142 /DNA_ID=CAMNT_0022268485 /DNA_START=347 /DNA_END=773 /DNA_ORIENTATION=-
MLVTTPHNEHLVSVTLTAGSPSRTLHPLHAIESMGQCLISTGVYSAHCRSWSWELPMLPPSFSNSARPASDCWSNERMELCPDADILGEADCSPVGDPSTLPGPGESAAAPSEPGAGPEDWEESPANFPPEKAYSTLSCSVV